MKTAITELIETIDKRLQTLETVKVDDSESEITAAKVSERIDELYMVRNSLTHKLPKEREQIEGTYIDGVNDNYSNGQGSFSTSATEYFNKTYEQ
tara:strand:- start:1986 stop:2270 length:285 start_codon:yes stop_codon:yes gene_type:complete